MPQNSADAVRVGVPAVVSVRELPGKRFNGRIARTSNALDPTTRTLRAEVLLDNPSGVLLPGMFAQVKMTLPVQNPPVLVPSGALVSNALGNNVAVVQNGVVAFRPVQVGRDFGESLQITQGLRVGDSVIANPTNDLRDGERVQATLAQPAQETGGTGGSGQKPAGGGGQSASSKDLGSGQGDSASLNAKAKKLSSREGNESNSPEAQPGGAARAAAQQKAKGGKAGSQ